MCRLQLITTTEYYYCHFNRTREKCADQKPYTYSWSHWRNWIHGQINSMFTDLIEWCISCIILNCFWFVIVRFWKKTKAQWSTSQHNCGGLTQMLLKVISILNSLFSGKVTAKIIIEGIFLKNWPEISNSYLHNSIKMMQWIWCQPLATFCWQYQQVAHINVCLIVVPENFLLIKWYENELQLIQFSPSSRDMNRVCQWLFIGKTYEYFNE